MPLKLIGNRCFARLRLYHLQGPLGSGLRAPDIPTYRGWQIGKLIILSNELNPIS